jgi:hypothetical protein
VADVPLRQVALSPNDWLRKGGLIPNLVVRIELCPWFSITDEKSNARQYDETIENGILESGCRDSGTGAALQDEDESVKVHKALGSFTPNTFQRNATRCSAGRRYGRRWPVRDKDTAYEVQGRFVF